MENTAPVTEILPTYVAPSEVLAVRAAARLSHGQQGAQEVGSGHDAGCSPTPSLGEGGDRRAPGVGQRAEAESVARVAARSGRG
jgi:hypothetical protein